MSESYSPNAASASNVATADGPTWGALSASGSFPSAHSPELPVCLVVYIDMPPIGINPPGSSPGANSGTKTKAIA
jgi:hypothetical protein